MAATSSASSFLATTAPHCNYTLRKNPLPATATALSLNPSKTLSLSAASSSSVSAASKPSRKPLQASSYVEGREGIWSLRDDLVGMSGVRADGKPKEKGPPPMVFDRFQGVIDQLFHHRIIRVGGPVEDDVANIVVSQLLYLDALDPTKDIVMYINSPGGSVTAGMAIFDTMKHIRANVSTVCVGLAASMAAFLLATGSTGKRYSLPNARIMIHQPIGGAQGSQSDMEIQVNEVLHHRAVLSGYLAYHTGQPLEKILKDTDRDFFMSAKEAKEYGLIDDIITNPLKALQNQPVSN